MSKAKRIQALLKSGKSIKEVAKATKSSEAYVYYVRWTEKKRDETAPKKASKKAVYKSPRSRLVQDIFQMKKALDVVEKKTLDVKPTKLFVQPQYKDAAMKILANNDLVNHPPHYKAGGIETIDFIEAKDLNYRLGNVVKYVSRAGRKDSDPVQDLQKAAWYLQREIEARRNA
jgi:hypothetical protein